MNSSFHLIYKPKDFLNKTGFVPQITAAYYPVGNECDSASTSSEFYNKGLGKVLKTDLSESKRSQKAIDFLEEELKEFQSFITTQPQTKAKHLLYFDDKAEEQDLD